MNKGVQKKIKSPEDQKGNKTPPWVPTVTYAETL